MTASAESERNSGLGSTAWLMLYLVAEGCVFVNQESAMSAAAPLCAAAIFMISDLPGALTDAGSNDPSS